MNDIERAYSAAVRYAMRHVQDCCYGRPCLEECLRRLGASLPPCACAGGWRPPRWAKWLALSAALLVFVFAALRSNAADVQCIWNGSTYVCSGTGSSIEVIGGGNGGPVTVTNVWGVCTNCVNMTPSYCEQLKSELTSELDYLLTAFSDIYSFAISLSSSCYSWLKDIETFRRFSNLPRTPLPGTAEMVAFTNYVETAGNTQSLLVRENADYKSPITQVRYRAICYSNGIYDFGQQVAPDLRSYNSLADDIASASSSASERTSSLRQRVNVNLTCDQCEAGDGKPPPGSGSGSSFVTNGNWCTFDQGEAIKDLLRDLKTWAERQHSQLSSISNYVKSSYETLKSGLFSDYTAIPLGEDWKDLYLTGQPTGWGYDPTNILQRLEVLLYGISGVGTNSPASLEDTTPDADDAVDDISDSVASIVTDADGTAAKTLGDAVLEFFRAFTPRTKNYQGGEEIIAEVSIKVGDETHYVPAMRLGESGFLLDTMTAVKSCVNGFCCVLFWVGGAFVIFRFWAWFASWCVKLSKWAVELCTSLFAS